MPNNIDLSENELKLRQLEARDRKLRIFQVVVLLGIVMFNIFTAIRLQNVIDRNQANAVEARKSNIARQDELKNYIKCIILLRYDNTNLGPDSPRKDVETALDRCAKP